MLRMMKKSQLTECWHQVFWKFDHGKSVDSNLGSVTDVWGQTEVIFRFHGDIVSIFNCIIYNGRKKGKEGGRKEMDT